MPLENPTGTIANFGSGSIFPPSPSTGQVFFRTDQDIQYFYDGTRWLSVQQFSLSMPAYAILPNGIAANANPLLVCPHDPPSGQVYLEKWTVARNTATPNDSPNNWQFTLRGDPGTDIVSTSTRADGIAVWARSSLPINSVQTLATDKYWYLNVTKTGTPGTTNFACTVTYRIVG